jgi:hypothetical protein
MGVTEDDAARCFAVRDDRAGTLNKQLSALHFNDGETVDEFAIRITGLVNQLALLGKTIPESNVVRKFLEVVPRKYMQIACPSRPWWT